MVPIVTPPIPILLYAVLCCIFSENVTIILFVVIAISFAPFAGDMLLSVGAIVSVAAKAVVVAASVNTTIKINR